MLREIVKKFCDMPRVQDTLRMVTGVPHRPTGPLMSMPDGSPVPPETIAALYGVSQEEAEKICRRRQG